MPHKTQAYPFELKILIFAQSLSTKLAGGNGHHSFLMILNDNGSVRTLQFEHSEDTWYQLTEKLNQAGESYLFYDPFDAPEYMWLSWRQIDRSTMERLIGTFFEETDFEKSQNASHRAPDLKPPKKYPVSWGVMF